MPRLIDMGIEPFLLIASVNVVAAQRLVRKVCPHCKTPMEITNSIETEIRKNLVGVPKEYLADLDLKQLKIFKGAGCDRCGHTGYQGRFGIFEVLPITSEVQDLVQSKTSGYKIYELAAKMGMITMQQDGILKVLHGETTFEEVIRVTTE